MAPFEHADTAFASRAPFLRTFEPALLFPLPSFFTVGADAAEAAIDDVRSNFSFQHFITPVTHVLENEHAERDFRRRLLPSTRPAPWMPFALRLVHGIDQFLVL